ncbi:MAG: ABC transporter substrate-binding protein [Verrucomicrobia bacterium]|nr:ABC transporter substrate-binding protein [Verrucomicrobiota bacterium]
MKQKTVLLVITLAVIAAVVWLVSRQNPHRGNSAAPFVVATETEITTLDPIKNLDPHLIRIEAQIFEGLVGLDEQNEIMPRIAQSWEPVGGFDRWRFKIRPGVKFHSSPIFGTANTRNVTAEDVVFSFNRIMGKGSSIGWIVEGVIKRLPPTNADEKQGSPAIKAVSESEIEIELTAPDPFFVHRLTSTPLVIMPRELASIPEGDFGVKTTVGTGPFLVKSRNDAEVVLEANPAHWETRAGNLSTLIFRLIKNDQIRLQELQNGQVNFARVPSSMAKGVVTQQPSGGVKTAGAWAKLNASAVDTFNVVALGFNSDKMDRPLRQAINAGLRRTDLVKLIPEGLAVPATSILPPAISGADPSKTPDPYSADNSRKAFAASTSTIKTTPIEILVHEKDSSEDLGQLIQSQLQDVGIATKLTKLDYNTVIGRMISGEFTTFIIGFEFTFPAAPPILEMNYNPAKIPVPNFWRYRNDSVTAFLKEFQTTADKNQVRSLVDRIDAATAEDPPAAFLIHNKMLVLYSGNVSEVPINGQSVPLFWKVNVK